jgi:hypothetical protein
MKTFREFLNENTELPSHKRVLSAITKAFEKHKTGDANFETVHLHKNAHTGATKHQVGSVKAHSLGWRVKRDAPDAFTGREPYDRNRKYAQHPMEAEKKSLAKKFKGTIQSSGHLMIHTKEGKTHHISFRDGSAYHTYDHSHN